MQGQRVSFINQQLVVFGQQVASADDGLECFDNRCRQRVRLLVMDG